MKKIPYIVLFVLILGLCSCENELDQIPVSSITTGNFYSNTNDFTQAVNGAYSQLKAYPNQSLWLSEMRSDNIAAVSDGNRDWQGVNDFSPNLTTTGFIVNAWSNMFNGIYNANTVLDALETKGGNISDESLRIRFGAECRFLRAFYYFQLVRLYGKLPILNKAMTATEVAGVPRSSVTEVYDFIIEDLEYAATNLPASYNAANVGRATSYAAKGILGLVYLTRSGPTYGIEGPGLDSNEYDKALALFNEIITSNQFAFLSDYASIFSYTNENNKEVIFDVQFISSSNGAGFPSQLVPVAYWTSLGISNTYGNGYGASNFNVSDNLRASYESSEGEGSDVREDFTIQLSYSNPFVKKYIDLSKKGTSGTDWPVNFIVLRYTDVLLMKAECILHGATGTQEDVDAIVNQVRARAGVAPVSNVTLEVLMEERRREFLGEGLRWNDLVRSGQVITTMNAWRESDDLLTISEVIPNYVIYPVPAAEILAKPGLYTQNPGYY
ncbi:RagB/SusD family nutrient uptake outer membrane protein [Cytophagaceae bacterium DM2B3-1]|uniref:RagB/SusD family nutrient uptake outer membrane protein n=1 Tax=Xanthocytophaga flava TaxID=3048013 RepID=A0ABT7CIT7_9BACT|nr:RagB/SusD family nutrient uptake outer membrane protein [Xanthocytophaga flavus]MDJ1493652.1 RagB/SusD family nutrient uptake outer membrane protein [Xanthocytophaga flavus]